MGKPNGIRRQQSRRSKSMGMLPMTEIQAQVELTRQPIPLRQEFEPRTEAQRLYASSMEHNVLTFGVGPAGTGKTYVAAACAAEMLLDRVIDRVVVTRPAVEAGEELGFLPGEIDEKVAPWFAPFRIELEKRLGKGAVEAMVKNERIIFLPFAHMRGHTFENAFVVLDEAQNTTPTQMKLFLTRVGEGTRVVIDGDLAQADINGKTGLQDALERLVAVPRVGTVSFGMEDIVRSGFVRDVLYAYAA